MELINEGAKKRMDLINFLSSAAVADSEEDVNSLLAIFHPVDDRDEMGKVYTEALGYNPITHYDMSDILRIIDDAMDCLSTDGRNIIMAAKDDIAERAFGIYEDNRLKYLSEAVAAAIEGAGLSVADENAITLKLTGSTINTIGGDDDEDEIGSVLDNGEELSLDDMEPFDGDGDEDDLLDEIGEEEDDGD